MLDPEQPEDREVLVRLRPRALAGVDDEQEEVDPGRAGDHRAHEALVPGNVDDREPPPVRELERRVAEVDRDPAPLLLGQPVGVLPGQRADEPRLAVVDVAGGADRERPRSRRALTATAAAHDLVDLGVRERAAVEERPPVANDRDHRRLAAPERLRERLLDGAGRARQLGERERAAADARDGLLHLAADERGEPLGARANGLERLVEHPQHGHLVARGRVEGEQRACPRARRA